MLSIKRTYLSLQTIPIFSESVTKSSRFRPLHFRLYSAFRSEAEIDGKLVRADIILTDVVLDAHHHDEKRKPTRFLHKQAFPGQKLAHAALVY